jgi:hypothetical protein
LLGAGRFGAASESGDKRDHADSRESGDIHGFFSNARPARTSRELMNAIRAIAFQSGFHQRPSR